MSVTQSGTPLLQREFSWMKAIETCTHDTNLEFLDVFQGMHLRTCGEVLPLGGSDTCDHAWTSPRSYVQRRLLQHLPMDMTMTMLPDDDDDVRMILLCDVDDDNVVR